MKSVPVSPQWQTLTTQDEALLQPTHATRVRPRAFRLSPDGPYLIASDPILTSEGDRPTRGALIMARALTEAEIARLGGHHAIAVERCLICATRLIRRRRPRVRPCPINSRSWYARRTNNWCRVIHLIKDIHDQPALILRVDYPRNIYQQGQQTLTYLLLALFVAGLLVGGTLVLLLERTVIARLRRTQPRSAGYWRQQQRVAARIGAGP